MTLNTLKDLYVDQLQDMYSADRQSLEITRQLQSAAKDEKLSAALKRGVNGIEKGMEALSGIIRNHGAEPTGEFCKGMEGLVKEARAHVLEADISDDDVRDASIITQYQRMTHYAIAGYGCCAAFAKRLKLNDEAKKLDECLDETHEGDRVMTDIAVGDVNKAAA